ncbi:hypothetical protein BC938DRAFT_470568 [Jimgerdemannia flammicorona]|uniref:Large ribosomal subunit protein uL15/eL18 domain-containing protein n=1 Tax=Jimgerdemannia flammicorona TaxID=994334 RepID=A0A433Q9Z2_9FUNG|nr:hypothetical protein BC938DRAFT_470568 [Jimgerdemannia flammicorona]
MELEEIRLHNRRELPNLPDDLLKHMMTFAKGTIQELRKQLQQPIDAIGDNFIREIHYDLDWLQYAMYTLVREYESGALKVNHHEQWYNIHLWGPIVDQCFANILDMEGVRGESCSVASGIRKNINRETPSKEALTKWKCGRKADLILRTTADLEFGGGEAGRMYKSEKGTKWLLESGMKLPKMLKDMLAQLAAEVNWSKRTLRELLVVGFVHGGRRQMLLELDCPEGFTCRLRRGKVYNVAESVETHAAKTLPLLAATWRAKAAVRNCVHLVLTHTTDGDAEDEVLRLIKEAGSTDSFESRGDVLKIPPCLATLPPTSLVHHCHRSVLLPICASAATRSFVSFIEQPKKKIGLGTLADNEGATKERTRLGRGPGSGRGKTAGRGHKGQNARSGNGKPTPIFEGGQTPLVKRIPKRGFHNPERKEYQPLNLDRLQHWIDTRRIDASQPITMKHLLDTRCIHKLQDGVKLLADVGFRHFPPGAEYFKTPVNIEVSRASRKAIETVEQAGGTIICQHYHSLGLRALRFPEKFNKLPKIPFPGRKEKGKLDCSVLGIGCVIGIRTHKTGVIWRRRKTSKRHVKSSPHRRHDTHVNDGDGWNTFPNDLHLELRTNKMTVTGIVMALVYENRLRRREAPLQECFEKETGKPPPNQRMTV